MHCHRTHFFAGLEAATALRVGPAMHMALFGDTFLTSCQQSAEEQAGCAICSEKIFKRFVTFEGQLLLSKSSLWPFVLWTVRSRAHFDHSGLKQTAARLPSAWPQMSTPWLLLGHSPSERCRFPLNSAHFWALLPYERQRQTSKETEVPVATKEEFLQLDDL